MQSNKDNMFINESNSVLEIAILSVIGDREEQQDSFGLTLRHNEGLVVICDGMGGHNGGKIASDMVVRTILEKYEHYDCCIDETNFLIDATIESDKKVAMLSNKNGEYLGAGSTLVSAFVHNKSLDWCSVGDSRAYLLRKGDFVQFTQDQNYKTVLDEKLKNGFISLDEYNNELKRGEMLINYLGIGNISLIDHNSISLELKKDDKIVFMTDGLYKLLTDDEIKHIVNNFSKLEEAVYALEIKAQSNAKKISNCRDNMTVAIMKVK